MIQMFSMNFEIVNKFLMFIWNQWTFNNLVKIYSTEIANEIYTKVNDEVENTSHDRVYVFWDLISDENKKTLINYLSNN